MTLRIGIIGAGIMGADHALTVNRFVSGATVSMVADVDLARAESVTAGLPGSGATADAVALIRDPSVDAVIIASHDSTHAALCLEAITQRKPALCEKPLAPTVDECVTVVRAEREAVGDGTPLISLGFMRRFDPGYAQMKAALQAGDCGPAVLVHSTGRGVSSGPGTTTESSVTNSAIHDLDIVPWLLDSPVVSVSWHAGRPTAAADGFQDPYVLLLRTADGTLSTVEIFLNARYGYDVRCEIVGETGTLALTEPARVVADGGLQRGVRYAADWRPRFADAYRLEVQAWVDAVTGGVAPTLATAQDGLVASAVAAAVITSLREDGRTVPIAVPAL